MSHKCGHYHRHRGDGLSIRSKLFFALGLCVIFAITLTRLGWPAWKSYAARGWQATPCVIDHAVMGNKGTQSDCAFVRVSYRYEFRGSPYRGDRYDFEGPDRDLSRVATIVASLPNGSRRMCYVNPSNPPESVLVRDVRSPTTGEWLQMALLAAGITAISLQMVRQRRRKEREGAGPHDIMIKAV